MGRTGAKKIADEGTGRASRRRGTELEQAILEAAWAVLLELGYHGFTYEAVAARAATSRAVLYRRWPQREDLLRSAIARSWQADAIALPDTGNVRDDAVALLHALNARRPRIAALIRAQISDYFHDSGSSFGTLREAINSGGGPPPFERIVARAVDRGEVPNVARSSRVVNLPFDLFRHDVLMTMREVPHKSIAEMVDDLWLPLLRSAPATG